MSESERRQIGYNSLLEADGQNQSSEATNNEPVQANNISLCKRIVIWRRYLILILTPILLIPLPIAVPGRVRIICFFICWCTGVSYCKQYTLTRWYWIVTKKMQNRTRVDRVRVKVRPEIVLFLNLKCRDDVFLRKRHNAFFCIILYYHGRLLVTHFFLFNLRKPSFDVFDRCRMNSNKIQAHKLQH